MKIESLEYDFTICKVKSAKDLDYRKSFCFTSVTDNEISVVCITDETPENTLEREDGWKCFRICGTLDFSLVGILAEISAVLAEAEIGIFAVSTYDTDYIFVKKENYEKALQLLKSNGYDMV